MVMSGMMVYSLFGAWPLGAALCTVWQVFDFAMCSVSMLHLCIIAFDRSVTFQGQCHSQDLVTEGRICDFVKTGSKMSEWCGCNPLCPSLNQSVCNRCPLRCLRNTHTHTHTHTHENVCHDDKLRVHDARTSVLTLALHPTCNMPQYVLHVVCTSLHLNPRWILFPTSCCKISSIMCTLDITYVFVSRSANI